MSPTRSLTPRVGDTPLRRPPPPSPDCGRRSGSGVRRCHRAGWDWRKRRGGRAPGMGVASGGRSGLGGPRAPRAGRGCQGRRRARGAPALRPELQLLLPGLPGPGSPRRAAPARAGGTLRATHPPPPRRGAAPGAPGLAQVAARGRDRGGPRPARHGHCSPRASYLPGACGSGGLAAPTPGSAAPGPGLPRARQAGCSCGAAQPINTHGRRRRASGAWRRPAEVRAIKGGAGRRGGRSRRGGWGAGSGSPWPPRRRRASATRTGRSGAERTGRVPAPRRSRAPASLCPRRSRGRRPSPGLGRPLGGGSPCAASPAEAAGTAGEPQPPPASGPRPARPPRRAPPRGRCAQGGLLAPSDLDVGPRPLTSPLPPERARATPPGSADAASESRRSELGRRLGPLAEARDRRRGLGRALSRTHLELVDL